MSGNTAPEPPATTPDLEVVLDERLEAAHHAVGDAVERRIEAERVTG
ncbi:hypothetical protein [Streptomyces uncialis]